MYDRLMYDPILEAECVQCNQKTMEVVEVLNTREANRHPFKYRVRRIRCTSCGNKELIFADGQNDLFNEPLEAAMEALDIEYKQYEL